MPSTAPDALERVYSRARQLWWRRRAAPIGGALVLLAVLVAAPLVRAAGDHGRRVLAVTRPSAEPATTTTTDVVGTDTTVTTAAPTTTTAAPTMATSLRRSTTTTALVCRNSYDSRCGPFRWDPDPGPNEPSSMEITYTPAHPRAGEDVVFHWRVTNPDGPAEPCELRFNYGDGPESEVICSIPARPGGCRTPYGPWTPPERHQGTSESDAPTHQYKQAGGYTVTFSASSGSDVCDPQNPYRGPSSATTTITVSP